MLVAVSNERYVELFTELGHRWFDLKRTETIDHRMQIVINVKGGVWNPFKGLLPIPTSEFLTNSGLVGSQNPGYRER